VSSYKEIAAKSGVSIGTVYRVLHQRGRFSRETAERVRRVATELGYKKNIYASNLSRSRTYRIAVLMPDPSHDNRYWQQPHDGITAAIASLEQYRLARLDCFYDEHDPASFQTQLRAALDSRPDALILAPSLAAACEDAITSESLAMPHVIIDTLVPNTGRIGFVGQDSFASGLAAGRLLELMAPARGHVVAVRSLPASSHIERRIRGVVEYLSGPARLPVHEVDVDFADAVASRAAVEKILGSRPEPDAWFVSNSNASILSDMLDGHHCASRRAIVGYDLVPENVEALRDGRLAFLLSQRPDEQGRLAVEMIYRAVILGEHEPNDRFLPIDIVSPQTVDSHLQPTP
jgi:LacI family transcriptional regulator